MTDLFAYIVIGVVVGAATRAFWTCWKERPPVVRDADGHWRSARVWRRPK